MRAAAGREDTQQGQIAVGHKLPKHSLDENESVTWIMPVALALVSRSLIGLF